MPTSFDLDDPALRRETMLATGAGLRAATTPLPARRFGAAELPTGSQLNAGRFVVERVLGRGGFGITYACDDTRLHRRVAVKELAPSYPLDGFEQAKARFMREATVLARFNDPGIVRVYEVFEEHGTAYLVMELVEGKTLHELVSERGALPEAQVLAIAERCGRSLAVVHAGDVLHRDLKPANLVVAPAGRVVVIDFGLAREFAADHTGSMTRVVTPGYAPPEQYGGTARFGPASDVYGLAATLYFLLIGVAPAAAVDRQTGVELASPHRRNPAVSRMVSAAVMDGLELHPTHRPATMDAFLARLGLGRSYAPTRSVGDRGDLSAKFTDRTATPLAAPPPPATRPGRWLVDVPVLAAVAAMASAAPLIVVPALVMLLLPSIATAGDAVAFVRARRRGTKLRWLHRVALPAYAAGRFVRNLIDVLYRSVPGLVLAGGVVGVALLCGAAFGPTAREVVVRPGGAGVALLVAVPILRDRAHFRAGVVADLVYDRLLDGSGRYTTPGLVTVIVALAVAAAGIGFRPELWPV